MLTANDPRSNWIAGQLDRGDIEAQVRHFAAARVAAPDNRLYLASLATACLEPVQPRLPECDGVDRLADWATRDADNGWPSLLLAERARRHKNPEAMLAYLQQAAGQPRFVEYWEAGSLEFWEAVRAIPVEAEEAAKLELAVMYAMARSLAWPDAARATCMGAGTRATEVRSACAQLGAAMRERGSTWMSRLIGARMVARQCGIGGGCRGGGSEGCVRSRADRLVQPVHAVRSWTASRPPIRPRARRPSPHGTVGFGAKPRWARRAPARKRARRYVDCAFEGAMTQPAMRQTPSRCFSIL